MCTRGDSRAGRLAVRAMRRRVRTSGCAACARSLASSARNARTGAFCLSPTTSFAGTSPAATPTVIGGVPLPPTGDALGDEGTLSSQRRVADCLRRAQSAGGRSAVRCRAGQAIRLNHSFSRGRAVCEASPSLSASTLSNRVWRFLGPSHTPPTTSRNEAGFSAATVAIVACEGTSTQASKRLRWRRLPECMVARKTGAYS